MFGPRSWDAFVVKDLFGGDLGAGETDGDARSRMGGRPDEVAIGDGRVRRGRAEGEDVAVRRNRPVKQRRWLGKGVLDDLQETVRETEDAAFVEVELFLP